MEGNDSSSEYVGSGYYDNTHANNDVNQQTPRITLTGPHAPGVGQGDDETMQTSSHPQPAPKSFLPSIGTQGRTEYTALGPMPDAGVDEDDGHGADGNMDNYHRDRAALLSGSDRGSFDDYHDSSEDYAKSSASLSEEAKFDLFVPLPDSVGDSDDRSPLTFRALFLGLVLGTVVNVVELYSGLSQGIAVSASLLAPVVGYMVISALTRLVPRITWLGGLFGPRETAIVHATAVGAAGTAGIFTGTIPTMFKAKLLMSASAAFPQLLAVAWACTFGGLFAAAPLRDFIIVRSARELNLRFPSAEATAITIHSLHQAGEGTVAGVKRFKAMAIAFAAAFLQKIAAQYAKGLVYDWHFFTWIYQWSNYTNGALVVESWGWFLELTPTFWAFGMLVGLNIGVSIFLGTFLEYAVIGPIAVHLGAANGTQVAPSAGPEWASYVSYTGSGTFAKNGTYTPSVYIFLLWPGMAMLIFGALTELGLQLPSIIRGMKAATHQMRNGILKKFHSRPSAATSVGSGKYAELDEKRDLNPTNGKDVSFWLWSIGLLVVTVGVILISLFQWHVNAGWIVVALLLSSLLAVLNIYGEGTTGVSPGISNFFILLIFSGVVAIDHTDSTESKEDLLLLAMLITTGVADMANRLMGDYRVGFLLRVPPRAQFYAQFIGTFVSGLSSTGVFVFFAQVYPCLMSPTATSANCAIAAQASDSYVYLLPVVVAGDFTAMITTGSAYLALAFGLVAIIIPTASHFLLKGARAKYKKFMPNFLAMGLGFVLPYTYVSTAIFLGSVVAYIWKRYNSSGFNAYGIAVASGMIAGEGIGGLFGAILDISGVGNAKYGITAGCPAGLC